MAQVWFNHEDPVSHRPSGFAVVFSSRKEKQKYIFSLHSGGSWGVQVHL